MKSVIRRFCTIPAGWGIRQAARLNPTHIPVLIYVVTPSLLLFGVILLAGTLMVEHANLTDFL
jgi:hypothetical protein